MFGWKGYGFFENASEDNLQGKGEVLEIVRQFKPFIKYDKTDLITEKESGKLIGTMDLFHCPKWVADAITRWLELRHPEKGKMVDIIRRENTKTGEVTWSDK